MDIHPTDSQGSLMIHQDNFMKFKFIRRLFTKNPHSINIFINDNGTIDFIPSFYTKAGFGQETDYYREIKPPHTFETIGSEFILVWNESKKRPIIDETVETNITPAYKIISGQKGYSSFQKERQMICATFCEKKSIHFTYWYKQKRGYGLNKSDEDISMELPLHSSCSDIGKVIDEIYFKVNQRHIVSL